MNKNIILQNSNFYVTKWAGLPKLALIFRGKLFGHPEYLTTLFQLNPVCSTSGQQQFTQHSTNKQKQTKARSLVHPKPRDLLMLLLFKMHYVQHLMFMYATDVILILFDDGKLILLYHSIHYLLRFIPKSITISYFR